ncbi:hypothetical protein OUY22_14725 [Nonomuraea sp. MCN248]|uniref:Uncharacterized protein n=1 Tax=Nonomuraea corallina TaxID=2989783 RepID=A0ABT4SBZ1_9ACTN|nr:hypothetical protein [Nonomuraea corallina]MDA0634675.1 hypothetical protein [Nonomuraea corallina]
MTQPPDEYGELLRRALRAEAEAVVPSPDGLDVIRTKIERRGARNLFWWRTGAAAASAVLVAATIVMVVPELRHRVIEAPIQEVRSTSSVTHPAKSSTSRPAVPRSTVRQSEPVVVPPVPSSEPPPDQPARPSETARSTAKPTPSPTATPCPSPADGQAEPPDCPEAGDPPPPSPTETETSTTATPCPEEECKPLSPAPSPSDMPSPMMSAHTIP